MAAEWLPLDSPWLTACGLSSLLPQVASVEKPGEWREGRAVLAPRSQEEFLHLLLIMTDEKSDVPTYVTLPTMESVFTGSFPSPAPHEAGRAQLAGTGTRARGTRERAVHDGVQAKA